MALYVGQVLEYLSLMNKNEMTFTQTDLLKILGNVDPDNRVYNAGNGWECQGGYEDYVRGWLDTQYDLRQKLNLLTDGFMTMFNELNDYLDENS
jgi:hypothetical protein